MGTIQLIPAKRLNRKNPIARNRLNNLRYISMCINVERRSAVQKCFEHQLHLKSCLETKLKII